MSLAHGIYAGRTYNCRLNATNLSLKMSQTGVAVLTWSAVFWCKVPPN
jgi:hypothetical protein